MSKYDSLPDKIKNIARKFDDAIVNKDLKTVLETFHDDCEIELLNVTLEGREGVENWFYWLYRHVEELEFIPVTIMVENNTFFEEFIVKGTFRNGKQFESKQSEVLEFEEDKITSLRIYFDRLDFAAAINLGFPGKTIIEKILTKSTEGLI